jgi:hypothetical protein
MEKYTYVIIAISFDDSKKLLESMKADLSAGKFVIDVLHYAAYRHPITEEDFDSLYMELDTDPTFGLVGENVFLLEAPDFVRDMCLKLVNNYVEESENNYNSIH